MMREQLKAAKKEASLSECGTYRHWLSRTWDPELDPLLWVMLNPSTADAHEDDATIRLINVFSWMWGYGGIIVVNNYAWRATDPADLVAAAKHRFNVVGNDDLWFYQAERCRDAVCAWGNGVLKMPNGERRVGELMQTLHEASVKTYALEVLASGHPRHPLRVPYSTVPVPFTCQTTK